MSRSRRRNSPTVCSSSSTFSSLFRSARFSAPIRRWTSALLLITREDSDSLSACGPGRSTSPCTAMCARNASSRSRAHSRSNASTSISYLANTSAKSVPSSSALTRALASTATRLASCADASAVATRSAASCAVDAARSSARNRAPSSACNIPSKASYRRRCSSTSSVNASGLVGMGPRLGAGGRRFPGPSFWSVTVVGDEETFSFSSK